MSGNLDIVAQPKLPEGRTGFVGFGFALIAFGGGLELHFEIEPWGRYESAENLGVEIHPLLRRDLAGPGQAGEGELFGLLLAGAFLDFAPWCWGLGLFAWLTRLCLGRRRCWGGLRFQVGFGGFPGDEEHLFGELDIADHQGLVETEGFVVAFGGLADVRQQAIGDAAGSCGMV